MCNSLVRHAWILPLVLVFTAGVAASQVAPLSLQNSIAWGGPIQPPDISSGDNRPVPVTSADLSAGSPADAADGPPADSPPADSPSSSSAADNQADKTASANPDNTVRQLGTPFPLQLQPQGLKIGPMYLTSVSDSFFYAVNTSPNYPTETAAGNSLGASLVSSKPLSRGILVIQAQEQLSVARLQPYFNSQLGATFTEQLSERWSLNASAQFTYFQNSILANPQYLLAYTNAGIVQQTVFLQQRGTNIYESNSISTNYQLSGRTQISFYPIIGAQFQYLQGGWSNVHQFGGGVSVTRTLTPDISVTASYSLSYSATSGAATSSPNWVNQNIGVGFQGTFIRYRGWSLGGSVSASSQRYGGSYTLTPTGSLRLLKSFGQSSIIAGYTRTEASNVLISSGYYEQGDVSYNRKIGQNVNFNVGGGAFRTSNTGSYYNGKRAGATFNYQLMPRLTLNAGCNFSHQNGVQAAGFSPFLGNTSYFNIGLNWLLGQHSGL